MKLDKKYEEIHQLCFDNKEILEKVGKCVCINCFKKFAFDEINEWVFYMDRRNTALCPYCSMDSVLPLTINGKELNNEDINVMNKYYFGHDED